MRTALFKRILLSPLLLLQAVLIYAQEASLFRTDVLPVFEKHCSACHRGESPAAGLDLSSAASLERGSFHGPVIVNKPSQDSVLFKKISNDSMLPKAAGAGLNAEQIETVRRWIDSGSRSEATLDAGSAMTDAGDSSAALRAIRRKDRNFWSFQPPVQPPLPELKSVLWKLNSNGLAFSPPTPKRTILPRAYFDLIHRRLIGDRADLFQVVALINHLRWTGEFGRLPPLSTPTGAINL